MHSKKGHFHCSNMSFIHGTEEGKEFLSHMDLVFEGLMGMVGIVKGRERGFVDDFGLENEVGGLIRVEIIQLLDSSRGYGCFDGNSVSFLCGGLFSQCLLVTVAGVSICEFSTPGDVVIYVSQSAQGAIPSSFNRGI